METMNKLFKFEPILKPTLWGGESWEISGVAGNESVVSEGVDKWTTLPRLIDKYGAALVGRKAIENYGNEFPLLVKFIDARQDLSVQVHPDDELARKRHNSRGKTEMWYVIDATPEATLLSGMSERMTPEEYVRAVEDNTIADKLCRYKVVPDDCFYLPAGRVHSIGAGAYIAEIQETSDITYRIYDFNRRDASGNTRELHTELAKDAIDFTVASDYRTHYSPEENKEVKLVDCPFFKTSVIDMTVDQRIDLSGVDSFVILMVCEGEVKVSVDTSDSRFCHAGEALLIAASAEELRIVNISPSAKVIKCNL